MNPIVTILTVLALLVCAGSTAAQRRDDIIPPRIERHTVVDEAGLQQWAPYEAPDCPVCKGTGKVECQRCKDIEGVVDCLECKKTHEAPCHACGGTGTTPDPFEKAICPGCNGAGSFPCYVCGGKGDYVLEGAGGRPQKCAACNGDGGFECSVCDGDRLVDVVKVRGGVAEAKLADLHTVREAIQETQVAVHDFTGLGTSRKDTKEYGKALAAGAKFAVPLKKTAAMADTLMHKELAKGDRVAGNDERKQAAFQRFRACNEMYLRHQMEILGLAIARQEHNAEVLAEKGDQRKE